MLECEFRAADRDLVVAETNLADDETDIGLPQTRVISLKLFPEHAPEAIDDFGRDATPVLLWCSGRKRGKTAGHQLEAHSTRAQRMSASLNHRLKAARLQPANSRQQSLRTVEDAVENC